MNVDKYHIMFDIDRGALLRPKRKGVALIEDSEWHYPFFNCDMVRTLLSQMIEVLHSGYTPYVSLKDRKEGETDWNTFFRQPFDCVLEGKENVKVFRYSSMVLHYGYYFNTPFFYHHYRRWCSVFQSLVRLNETTRQYVEKEYCSLFKADDRVLGVLCRGTDYIGHNGLPIQPQVKDVIKEVRLWMHKYKYNKIYLATECHSVFDTFNEAFPSCVITNRRTYYDVMMQEKLLSTIGQISFDRDNDNYLKGLEYLSSLVLLSRCKALLAGNCGGSLFSLFYNNRQYEHWKIYNIGNY